MTDQITLSAFEKLFLALSDRTRLSLLTLMVREPVTVGYLSDQLGESQPKTSRHLAYLRNAGLVSTTRNGKWVYYQVEKQTIPAVQNILSATLNSVSGDAVAEIGLQHQLPINDSLPTTRANILPETYMSDWEPNDLEIHLL